MTGCVQLAASESVLQWAHSHPHLREIVRQQCASAAPLWGSLSQQCAELVAGNLGIIAPTS